MNKEASFPWQPRIATKRCNLFTSRKKPVLEIFTGFHPMLDDRNITKIVFIFILLSISSSSSKFLCFTLPYEFRVAR